MNVSRDPFDELELIGMGAALIVAALFATHGVATIHPGAGPAMQVLLAAAGFFVTLAPFVLRHSRRSRAQGHARA